MATEPKARPRAKFQRPTTVAQAIAAKVKTERKRQAFIAKVAKPGSRERRREAIVAERLARSKRHTAWMALYAGKPAEKVQPRVENEGGNRG